MGLRHIHVFDSCSLAVEPLIHPVEKTVMGRVLIIVDPETGETWRYPVTLEDAKALSVALSDGRGLVMPNGNEVGRFA